MMMPACCRAIAAYVFVAALLPAGVVSGTVLEHATGYPLARARVRLDRIDSNGRVESASVLAGRTGSFAFSSVADGLYILSASRAGYASAVHGQRRPEGSAPPFAVVKDSNLFAELRLRKLGAISGRVLDENRVGVAGLTVSAYPAAPPFRAVARAVSDDRGVYRLHGLAPGRYRVRTTAFHHDDGMMLLPTFGPESLAPKDGVVVEARFDQDTSAVDVTPIPGALISIGGAVTCAANAPAGPVTVTIAHETVRRTIVTACQSLYRADNLPPGPYEIFAIDATGRLAAFVEDSYQQSTVNATVELREIGATRLRLFDEAGRTPVDGSGRLTLWRVDPYGVAETREVDVSSPMPASVILPPGYWEMQATLAPPLHLTGVHPAFRPPRFRPAAHPDRFDFLHDRRGPSDIVIRTSGASSSLRGRVVESGQPVAGIPVILWPADAATRRLRQGRRQTTTNLRGEFRWESLPPGEYLLAASYDVGTAADEPVPGSLAIELRDAGGRVQELEPLVLP